MFRAIYYARDRARVLPARGRYTEKKLVFDLNPRQYRVDDVLADLRAAGFGEVELRPFFVPQTVSLPAPLLAAAKALERSGPLARLALRALHVSRRGVALGRRGAGSRLLDHRAEPAALALRRVDLHRDEGRGDGDLHAPRDVRRGVSVTPFASQSGTSKRRVSVTRSIRGCLSGPIPTGPMRTVTFPVVRARASGTSRPREPNDGEAGLVLRRRRSACTRRARPGPSLEPIIQPSVCASDERVLQLQRGRRRCGRGRRPSRRATIGACSVTPFTASTYSVSGNRRERAVDGVEVGREDRAADLLRGAVERPHLAMDGLKNSVSQMPVASVICWPRTTTEPPPVASSHPVVRLRAGCGRFARRRAARPRPRRPVRSCSTRRRRRRRGCDRGEGDGPRAGGASARRRRRARRRTRRRARPRSSLGPAELAVGERGDREAVRLVVRVLVEVERTAVTTYRVKTAAPAIAQPRPIPRANASAVAMNRIGQR